MKTLRTFNVYVDGVFYKKIVDPKIARLLATFHRRTGKIVKLEVSEDGEPSQQRLKNKYAHMLTGVRFGLQTRNQRVQFSV